MGILSSIFKREAAPEQAAKGKRSARQQAADPADTVQRLRLQARRRLIGAAVLVGLGVLAFPIVFETQPRSVPMDLPIVIPSKDGPTPQRVATAEPALPASLPEGAQLEADAGVVADPSPPPIQEPLAVAAASPAASKPASKPSSAPPQVAEAKGRFIVQVGAYADKKSALEARQRLERKGLKTYAQVVQTKDGDRIRVRLGPFADRAEADKAVSAAKAAGLDGKVLSL
ncbi:MAG: SPOR domain-containing protein [Burkholderiales bacterium]